MYVRNLFMSNNRQHTQLYLRPEVRQRNQQIFYSVSAGHCQCALFHLIVGLAHHHHDHQQAIIYCIYMWCRSCCRTTFCPTANDEKNIKKKLNKNLKHMIKCIGGVHQFNASDTMASIYLRPLIVCDVLSIYELIMKNFVC